MPRPSRKLLQGICGEHLGAARVGYAELEGREYIVRREHTRGVEPLVGPPLRITVGATLREALRRGETIVVSDVQADQRLSDDDRASVPVAADRGVCRRGAVQRRADGCRVRRQSRHSARVDGGRDRARSRGRRADLGRRRAHPRRSGTTGAETAAPPRARSVGRRLMDLGRRDQ